MDKLPPTQQPQVQQVQPPIEPHNPLLDRIRIPGETYRIPSRGIFYTNGELANDVKEGEVHIYPMTAIDEITIRSPDKLFSGDAICEVFGRCIPDILKPKELFSKDIDFLMVCLRKISYGNKFDIKYTHDCDGAKEHTYSIPMEPFIKNAKLLDPTTTQGLFSLEMDNGQQVKIHPIKYKDVIELVQAAEDDKELSVEDTNSRTVETISRIIESVDGITDHHMIEQWISQIPVGWAHAISAAIEAASDWGTEFTYKLKCKDCKKMVKIDAPMNPVSFFTSY